MIAGALMGEGASTVAVAFARLLAEDEGVRVALVEVSDQRCPVDVNCVWAGYAKLTLEVSQPGAVAERVVIGTGGPRAGIPGDADLGPYHFSLTALEPRPSQRAPVPPSSYRATIVVSRR